MPQKTSNAIDRAWAESLGAALKIRGRLPPGDGWKTVHELMEEFNAGRVRTRTTLQTLVKQGCVEVFTGCEINSDNKLARQVWYRPKALSAGTHRTPEPTTSSARARP